MTSHISDSPEPTDEPAVVPQAQGLYDPAHEHDACGVGFIADMKGRKSHAIVRDALRILENLEHRGAVGADPLAGDGAGILMQIPHDFLKEECRGLGFTLPPARPLRRRPHLSAADERLRAHCERIWARIIKEQGLELLGWRSVPVDNSCHVGDGHRDRAAAPPGVHRPAHRRSSTRTTSSGVSIWSRKIVSNAIQDAYKGRDIGHYTVSLSSRTLVYKGMFLSYQVKAYYKDLSDPRFVSAMALVHQRFSTNTFPSWKLAHPYRMVAHNGEINTLRGNVNWMAARAGLRLLAAVRRRHRQAVAHLLRGPVRHRVLRQRARVPRHGRLQPRARGDDADPGGVGRQSADGPQAARLLRVPRLPDGAVGRPGGHGLHRRPPDRRHARPQRLAAGTLLRDQGRPRHHVLGGGRAAGAGGAHRCASGGCSRARCC